MVPDVTWRTNFILPPDPTLLTGSVERNKRLELKILWPNTVNELKNVKMLYEIVRHGLGVLNINHNSDKLTYCASLWLQISTLLIIYFRRSKNILFVIVLVLFYLPLSFYSFPCSRHKGVKWYLLRQPFFQRFCPPFFTFVCRFITFWKSFACSAMILYESDDIFRDRMIIIYARKFNRKRWSKTMKIAFSNKNSPRHLRYMY